MMDLFEQDLLLKQRGFDLLLRGLVFGHIAQDHAVNSYPFEIYFEIEASAGNSLPSLRRPAI